MMIKFSCVGVKKKFLKSVKLNFRKMQKSLAFIFTLPKMEILL